MSVLQTPLVPVEAKEGIRFPATELYTVVNQNERAGRCTQVLWKSPFFL